MNLIAERLKFARKAVGLDRKSLSQEDLALLLPDHARLDRAAINKIERQQRAVRDYEVVALAEALGVHICWLLSLSEKGGPK